MSRKHYEVQKRKAWLCSYSKESILGNPLKRVEGWQVSISSSPFRMNNRELPTAVETELERDGLIARKAQEDKLRTCIGFLSVTGS